MEIKPKIYFVGEREVHMFGESVGVCWNLIEEEKRLHIAGAIQPVKVDVRSGEPYIDFVYIRKDNEGNFYEDEDSSVAGGINTALAKEIVKELKLAIEYIATLK